MAERELAIVVRARDLASKGIKNIRKNIDVLGKSGKRAINGLSTAMTRLATGAAVALVGAIALGAKSLGHLERVTNATNAVIESTKGVAGQSTEAIREHAEALEALTTADDKAIQEGQNMLLTFTKIGGKTFPKATKAVVDMAIAMAKGDVNNADFAGTAIQVGKALNDPIKGVTALGKAGVSFTKQQKKQIETLVKAGKIEQAQAIILAELAVEFGNAGEAAGKGFEADIRRVQDAGEDASAALARGVMPALARFANFLSTKLADPAVIATLDEIGVGLGKAADKAIDFIEHMDFAAIGRGLGQAKDAAKTIVDTFMGLPDWVKQAVIGGWGLNKLTGGAVTSLLGGVIKGVLGMTAGVVNIKAGVVNGGGPGAPTPGNKPGLGNAGKLVGLGAILAAVEEPIRAGIEYGAKNTAMGDKGLNAAEIAAVKFYQSDPALQQTIAKRLGYVPTKADFDSGTRKLAAEVDGSTAAVERMRSLAGVKLDTVARNTVAVGVAAKNAGAVAKSGGISAAVAIRNKDMSLHLATTVVIRPSLREQANGNTRTTHRIL